MHRRVSVPVYLPTGRMLTLRLESTSNAHAICRQLCKRLHLDLKAQWAIYETYNDLGSNDRIVRRRRSIHYIYCTERKLQPSEFLLDIVCKWELYIQMMDGADSESCHFVFKRVVMGEQCVCNARPDSRFVFNQVTNIQIQIQIKINKNRPWR